MTDKIVVLSTCANEQEAERVAALLLDQRLAACVSVVPRLRSHYRWKGAVESAEECLLLIKSSRPLFDALRAAVEKAHSYEVPEVLALAVLDGSPNYLDWLQASIRSEIGGFLVDDRLRLAGNCPLAPGLALIFDLDGVIVNSNPWHRKAWTAFNFRYGVETTDAMLQRMYGKRNDAIIRDFFGDGLSEAEVAARGAAKEEIYREMIGGRIEEILVPGLRAFLECYPDAPKALASNAEPQNIDFLLDRAALRPYFRFVLDGHQVSQPKPNPEIYLRAASLLETAPANCIVFEDSHTGVEAALASGARVVGIGTTHGDLPGTDLNVDNFCSGNLRAWLAVQSRTE